MSLPPVITIDGPAAAGKGIVSSLLARILGYRHLESGSIYRSLAVVALQENLLDGDDFSLSRFFASLTISWNDAGLPQIQGYQLPSDLQTPEISSAASYISRIPPIREFLLPLQRECRRDPGLVADGRDMGTVVFPDASLKIFLTASLEVRAKRRFLQLKQKGMCVTMDAVQSDIQYRDFSDETRCFSALKVAGGSVVIDSTDLSIQQVVEIVVARFRRLVF